MSYSLNSLKGGLYELRTKVRLEGTYGEMYRGISGTFRLEL